MSSPRPSTDSSLAARRRGAARGTSHLPGGLVAVACLACGCGSGAANGHARARLESTAPDASSSERRAPTDWNRPTVRLLHPTGTPAGPEVCWDALDNNGNGVIDEGCGVGTGPLQFAIAWSGDAVVELEVVDPTGRPAEAAANSQTATRRLVKDRENAGSDHAFAAGSFENVFWAGDLPTGGVYRVTVRLARALPSVRLPLEVRLGGRVGERSFGLAIELAAEKDTATFLVSYPPEAEQIVLEVGHS